MNLGKRKTDPSQHESTEECRGRSDPQPLQLPRTLFNDSDFDALIEIESKIPSFLLNGRNLHQMLTEATDGSDFLKRLLIQDTCKKNRYFVEKSKITGVAYQPGFELNKDDRSLLRKSLLDGFQQGSSVALWLSLYDILPGRRKVPGGLGYHAVVATGMRFNTSKNRCEIKIRNSWGANGILHGWVPLDKITKGLIGTTYFKN